MVGRAVMVWQHPSCFMAGVTVTVEGSGRGKCKQSKSSFNVGEKKISCTAHTTTSHFKLLVAGPKVMTPLADPRVFRAASSTH